MLSYIFIKALYINIPCNKIVKKILHPCNTQILIFFLLLAEIFLYILTKFEPKSLFFQKQLVKIQTWQHMFNLCALYTYNKHLCLYKVWENAYIFLKMDRCTLKKLFLSLTSTCATFFWCTWRVSCYSGTLNFVLLYLKGIYDLILLRCFNLDLYIIFLLIHYKIDARYTQYKIIIVSIWEYIMRLNNATSFDKFGKFNYKL